MRDGGRGLGREVLEEKQTHFCHTVPVCDKRFYLEGLFA